MANSIESSDSDATEQHFREESPYMLEDDSNDYSVSAALHSGAFSTAMRSAGIENSDAPRLNYTHGDATERNDFLDLATAISRAYQRRRYRNMRGLNNVPFDALGAGSDFEVSQPVTLSLSHSQGIARTEERIVIKRSVRNATGRPLKPTDVAKIVVELRVLDHMYSHDNIVTLRGVGWFYDNTHDTLVPCAQPALLLEHALGTLSNLLRSSEATSAEARLFLCKDVTMGLKALQEAGIGHGDLKPANVLIFARTSSTDHAPMAKYRAKVSDFSQARLTTSTSRDYLGGTRPYRAPERHTLLSSTDVQLADVWSLGILFAATMFDQERDINPLRNTALEGEPLADRILEVFEQQFRQSTLDMFWYRLWRNMFAYTLQNRAEDRKLLDLCDDISKTFKRFLHPRYSPLVDIPDSPVELLRSTSAPDLFISYEAFKPVSNQVKDTLEAELQAVCDCEGGLIRMSACFELAVVLLSSFAKPRTKERTDRGLQYLYRAAELGDIRAKALSSRLSRAFAADVPSGLDEERVQNWQREAAACGHHIALEELGRGNSPDIVPYDRFSGPYASTDQPNLHSAAASGDLAALDNLNKDLLLNEKNRSGETALVVAARNGQVSAILRLLDAGADPCLSDNNNANILHHAWCYQGPIECTRQVLEFCREHDYSDLFFQSAEGLPLDAHRSLHPTPPGTPLERAVAKLNTHLVDLFLAIMPRKSPLDGVMLRRALLLAFKSSHVSIQDRLISYVREGSSSEPRLEKPLWHTQWDLRGSSYTYIDAVVVGAVSGDGQGVDLPIDFWRACCLGGEAVDAVWKSIMRLVHWDMIPRENSEEMIDKAIKLAFAERSYDAISVLLIEKGEITLGVRNRCLSIRHLAWRSILAPFGPISELLREDWIRRRDCFFQVASNMSINYVDQIFHDSQGRTMTQQAIINGDRSLFSILVKDFGADLRLPAPLINDLPIDTVPHRQMNVYSLIARSEQFDWWFADEVWKLQIPLSWPLASPTVTDDVQLPPLFHALENHFWAMSFWLSRKNARMDEEVTKGVDLLQALLSPQLLDVKVLDFLFPGTPSASQDLLPGYFRNDPKYWMFQYLKQVKLFDEPYSAGLHSIDAPNTDPKLYKQPTAIEGWKRVFELHHPESDRFSTVGIYFDGGSWVPRIRRHCIFRQALCLSWDTLENTIKTYEEKGKFPRQPRLQWLIGSPLDDMSLQGMGQSDLWQKHWYLPSIWHRLVQQCVAIALGVLLVIYVGRTLEFRWPREQSIFADILHDFTSAIILTAVILPATAGIVVTIFAILRSMSGDSSDFNGRLVSNHPIHALIQFARRTWSSGKHQYLKMRYTFSVEDCDEYVLGSQYRLLTRQADFSRRKI